MSCCNRYLAAEGGWLGAVDCMLRMTKRLVAETLLKIQVLKEDQYKCSEGLAQRGELAVLDPDDERVLRHRLRDSRKVEAGLREQVDKYNNAVNVANAQGRTPLWAAVANRRLSVAERLVEGGADINLGDARGITPLIQAAIKDLDDMVAFLLHAKVDIEKRAKEGPTALGWARGCGSRASATLLLDAGACWDNDWGLSPNISTSNEDIDWVELESQALADAQAEKERQEQAATGTGPVTWEKLIGVEQVAFDN